MARDDVVRATLEAVAEGRDEVLADDASRFVRSLLSQDLDQLYLSLVARSS